MVLSTELDNVFSKANHSIGPVIEQQGNTPPLTELSIATLIKMIKGIGVDNNLALVCTDFQR